MAAGLKTIKIAFLGDSTGLIAAATSGTKSLNKFAIGIAAGAVASGAKMVQMAAAFQTSTTKLVTSAGESQKGLATVQNGILNLAGQVGDSASELSAAMYTIESGGQHGAAGLKVLQAAAEGAKAEGADLTTVSDAVTSVLQDYHLSADQAALVTSKMVAAVGAGKTTFEQFAGSLSSVLPLASSAGISFDDISAAIASMTVHGVSAEQATDNLADVIRHMVSPTQVQTKELAQLGVNSQDLAKMLSTKGLTGTLQFLSQTILTKMGPSGKLLLNSFNQSQVAAQSANAMIAAMPPNLQKLAQGFQNGSITLADWRKDLKALPADQANLLTQFATTQNAAKGFSDALKSGSGSAQTYQAALSKVTGDATGLGVALQLTGENTAYVQNAVKKVSGATTEAGNHVAGWGEIQKTFNQRMAETRDTLNAVAIRIGSALLPYAQKLIDAVGAIVDWLGRNQSVAKALAIGIGLLAAGFVATRVALVAANLASKEWWASTKVVQAATKIWTAVQWALNTSFLGFPVFWVIAGILALIAAIILVIKYHKQIGAFFTAVWGYIWSFMKAVGAWFAGPFVNFFKAAGQAIATPFLWLWHSVFDPAWRGIAAGAQGVATAALWLWHNVLDPVWQGIAKGISFVNNIVVSLFNLWVFVMRNTVGVAALWLWHNVFDPAWQGIAAGAQWLWNSVIMPVFNFIKAAVLTVGNVELWLWHNAFQPAINGIASAAQWLWNNVLTPVWNAIKSATLAVGNAELWLWHSAFVPAINGVASVAKWLWNSVISPTWNAIVSATNRVGSALKSAFSGVAGFVKSAFNGAAGIVKGAFNEVIGAINKGISAANKLITDADKVPGVNLPRIGTIPKLAKGGPALAGRTYLVGEKGPELLTMGNTSGRVTPNNQLGGPSVIENHIEIGGEVVRVVRTEISESNRSTRRRVAAGAH